MFLGTSRLSADGQLEVFWRQTQPRQVYQDRKIEGGDGDIPLARER